ncbi:sensor histidine kinase [Qipengyuania atrilutea]|uniref:histidine kinase n=1 Tax=Qipengyuania atrilutea TaxID=2744473 RepID=A0A850GWC5_9SPHN|nr:ATP-binding protein [Actirhodobacter atriluteus]NVD43831.1 HAMP domain-containing protein [Actirhodobacter atriluteus]
MTAIPSKTTRRSPTWLRRLALFSRQANLFVIIEIACAAAFIIMAATTYLTFKSAPPDGRLLPSGQAAALLVGTLIPTMALFVLWGRRAALRRAAGSTARLHVRLVFLFSLIAAVPTLLVAGFAALLFQFGVDFWFSDNSRNLMSNVDSLAQGYYEQNQLDVGQETIAMAGDIRFYLERGAITDESFPNVYQYQAQARDISESVVVQAMPDGTTRAAAVFNLREDNSPDQMVEAALPSLVAGKAVSISGSPTRIEAVAPIDRDSGIYLYNARNSEATSFNYWQRAQTISNRYEQLISRARALQLRFSLALFVISLALVGLAVWFALRFADRQVEPLTDLVAAARRVGSGNFSMRVSGRTSGDEIGLLNRAFNRMTAQLEKQTDALVSANRQLEERRLFIEAVLESVSSGIISIDGNRRVLLMNNSAQLIILDRQGPLEAGLDLADMSPELDAMVENRTKQGLVNFTRRGELLTLAVKISEEADGHVITFEDITRQLLDQRQAAWSDVARRIAHEIKNPLTPIQLATERLKRRYRKQIETDADLFDELTSTIIRQVGDLRKMVDEFSSFARLPKPVFRGEDAIDLVRQSLFLQEVAHSDIDFSFETDAQQPLLIECDRHQIGQAVTNILKNAVEAIEGRAKEQEDGFRGKIVMSLEDRDDLIAVVVEDNGIGLPKEVDRIVEPYVTTREKGTGLGLAIVNKIVEEHGGTMNFSARESRGSRVELTFARCPAERAVQAAE